MARWDEAAARHGVILRIQRRMRIKQWAQKDLAKALGLARSSVSTNLAEEGDAWFAGEYLFRLPLVLDCTADWLFYARGPESPGDLPPSTATLHGYLGALDDMRAFLDEAEREKR